MTRIARFARLLDRLDGIILVLALLLIVIGMLLVPQRYFGPADHIDTRARCDVQVCDHEARS